MKTILSITFCLISAIFTNQTFAAGNSYDSCVTDLIAGGVAAKNATSRCRNVDTQKTAKNFRSCKSEFKLLGYEPEESEDQSPTGWCYDLTIQSNAKEIRECVQSKQPTKPFDLDAYLQTASFITTCAYVENKTQDNSIKATKSKTKSIVPAVYTQEKAKGVIEAY